MGGKNKVKSDQAKINIRTALNSRFTQADILNLCTAEHSHQASGVKII